MPRQTAKREAQPRTGARLAWAFWGIYLLVHAAGAILAFLARSYPDPPETLTVFSRILLFSPSGFVFPTVGALIAARHPRNPIGWLFLCSGFAGALGGFAEGYWRYALFVRPGVLPAGELMLWVNVRPYSIQSMFNVLLVLLFPTGRPPSRRWWIVGWVAILGSVINQVALAFMPGPLDVSVSIANPLGVPSAAGFLELAASVGVYMLVLGLLGAVLSLFARLRRAQGIERQQIKLLTYALVVYAAAEGAIAVVFSEQPLSYILFIDAFAAVFVAIAAGIAILRYRLWDIDLIIRRTLVYGVLTLTLGLVYFGCILLSRALVAPYLGGSDLAIVASTLAIAALFNPLRRRIQDLIDKRLYRRKYDAVKVLAAFGTTVRDETDLERLTAAMLHVVDETIQPEYVTVWLREPDRYGARESMHPKAP